MSKKSLGALFQFLEATLNAVTGGFDRKDLLESGVTIAPMLLLSIVTRDELLIDSALVAICTLRASQKSQLTLLGAFIHSIFVVVSSFLLLFSLPYPFIFAALCMALGVGVVFLESRGQRFRPLGSYIFIPVLYLACEMTKGIRDDMSFPVLLKLGTYLLFGALCAVSVRSLRYIANALHRSHRAPADHRKLEYQLTRLCTKREASEPGLKDIKPFVIAMSVAVGVVALGVRFGHIDYGQWAIWSAANVVTGDGKASRKRLQDRALGVLGGVVLGLCVGLFVPHTRFIHDICILIAITLIGAFKNYMLNFLIRNGFIAVALVAEGGGFLAGGERVLTIILGGVVGCFSLLATLALFNRTKHKIWA